MYYPNITFSLQHDLSSQQVHPQEKVRHLNRLFFDSTESFLPQEFTSSVIFPLVKSLHLKSRSSSTTTMLSPRQLQTVQYSSAYQVCSYLCYDSLSLYNYFTSVAMFKILHQCSHQQCYQLYCKVVTSTYIFFTEMFSPQQQCFHIQQAFSSTVQQCDVLYIYCSNNVSSRQQGCLPLQGCFS